VAVLACAALALHPADGLLHSARGPLGRPGVLGLGLVVAWVVGCSFALERVRERLGPGYGDLAAPEERLRQLAGRFLRFGPIVLGVAALALFRFGKPPASHRTSTPVPRVVLPTPTGVETPSPPTSSSSSGHSSVLPLTILLSILAAALIVLLVVVLLRRLRAFRPPLPAPAAPAADEDRELLLTAVRSGRRALAEGADARAAVIACYAAMEEALAASGVGRRASDSPADLLARATGAGLVTGPAAPRLTALFREARYSSHPMDDTRRAEAAAALEDIAGRLDDRTVTS
jgi:hypothetical protein